MSSSNHPYINPSSNPSFDEQRWIIHIRRALDDDLDLDPDIPVSIFDVPKTLMLISPESYVPQTVALGPYHHWRPELYEMERYKLAAAKRSQKQLNGLKFENLVHHLSKFEPMFRACYHKYLNFNGETLAWMMAVDSCFLLDFLHVFAIKDGKALTQVSSRMSHLVDATGRKSGHNAIVRDMVMLENQIPLFSLRKMLEFQQGSLEEADTLLCSMLTGFCKVILPFKMVQELPKIDQVVSCAHFLDLLYHLTVPRLEGSSEVTSELADEEQEINEGGKNHNFIQKIFSKLKSNRVSFFKRFFISTLVRFFWKFISNLPGMILIKQVEYLCFSQENEKSKQENESEYLNKPPLMEEIAIPSVSELSKAGLKFSAANSGISGITFDEKTATLHLPTIVLDVNTEVAMRNLVAYEACNGSGPLVFTRYTELMNGIIDTGEDAKLLREQGIILNHLKSDKDVANLWNGMSKSVRLTKVPLLDKAIEDVNNYYKGRWKVRIGKFMEQNVFGSWQSLTLLAAVLLLFFVSLQSFGSLVGPKRMN